MSENKDAQYRKEFELYDEQLVIKQPKTSKEVMQIYYLAGRKKGDDVVNLLMAIIKDNEESLKEYSDMEDEIIELKKEMEDLTFQLSEKSKEIGMCEHRGNTVDFIYDKVKIYSDIITERDNQIQELKKEIEIARVAEKDYREMLDFISTRNLVIENQKLRELVERAKPWIEFLRSQDRDTCYTGWLKEASEVLK